MRQEINEKGSRERDQLPYCMAVIMETLRYIPLIGLGAPRWTWEDIVVDGYKIPTGRLRITLTVRPVTLKHDLRFYHVGTQV